ARLFETGLFSSADVRLPENPKSGANIPIVVELKERAHRTVSIGLSYYSDEGFGTSAGWRHRNLLGSAETFETRMRISQQEQSLNNSLEKPYFLRQNQSLNLNADMTHEETDAYDETRLRGGAAIKRK